MGLWTAQPVRMLMAQGRLPSSRLGFGTSLTLASLCSAGALEHRLVDWRPHSGWKIDRVTSRHILEREIEAEVPIACMLSRGRLTESTAESLQSMAQPRKGPMLCRHCR